MRPVVLLTFVAAMLLHAQEFEVATVKVVDQRLGPTNMETVPGGLTMKNIGLGAVLMWAYKVSPYQIGNTDILGTGLYEITAKAAGPAKTDEMRRMMQALLADRFKLATHRQIKEMSAFAMVQTKTGHKLKLSLADDGNGVRPIQGVKLGLTGRSATLDQLAFFLSSPLGIPVLDKTGLSGHYDFDLDLTSHRTGGPGSRDSPADPVGVIQTELSKQLGLKLEPRKMPIDMLIIDHIETKPVEN
jgi:uncharacterized protein (TIGR03435 family)